MVMTFVECEACEFVFEAAADGVPEPRHWEACPNCDGESFRLLDR